MVTEKLEKSYDLWEKTETFGVEQRVRLYCMFISGGQSESGEMGETMKKIQTNQTKEKFYEKLNMEYQKERNHDKWHPCTHLIKKDGKYYVYYRSGKNVYKWSVQYLEDQQIIELQHVWNIADYVMWIPLAAMDVFFACFCVFNKLWQYIPVLCMVIAVLEFLPYYVFVARLGENVVTKYIISCLEDKDL